MKRKITKEAQNENTNQGRELPDNNNPKNGASTNNQGLTERTGSAGGSAAATGSRQESPVNTKAQPNSGYVRFLRAAASAADEPNNHWNSGCPRRLERGLNSITAPLPEGLYEPVRAGLHKLGQMHPSKFQRRNIRHWSIS